MIHWSRNSSHVNDFIGVEAFDTVDGLCIVLNNLYIYISRCLTMYGGKQVMQCIELVVHICHDTLLEVGAYYNVAIHLVVYLPWY